MTKITIKTLQNIIKDLMIENDELKEALYLYAVKDNWDGNMFIPDHDFNVKKGKYIYGKSARKALGMK